VAGLKGIKGISSIVQKAAATAARKQQGRRQQLALAAVRHVPLADENEEEQDGLEATLPDGTPIRLMANHHRRTMSLETEANRKAKQGGGHHSVADAVASAASVASAPRHDASASNQAKLKPPTAPAPPAEYFTLLSSGSDTEHEGDGPRRAGSHNNRGAGEVVLYSDSESDASGVGTATTVSDKPRHARRSNHSAGDADFSDINDTDAASGQGDFTAGEGSAGSDMDADADEYGILRSSESDASDAEAASSSVQPILLAPTVGAITASVARPTPDKRHVRAVSDAFYEDSIDFKR
jgi:hypothetical protein